MHPAEEDTGSSPTNGCKLRTTSKNCCGQPLTRLPKTKQDLVALQLIVVLIILSFYFLILIPFIRAGDPAATDFFKFYQSARFYLQGKGIYTPISFEPSAELLETLTDQGKESIRTLHPNLNSPLHTLTILPLAFLPYKAAFFIWSVCSLGAGLAAVSLIVTNGGICTESRLAALFGLWIVLLAYFPSIVNILLGQYGFIVLLCAVLVWTHARKGKAVRAGITLGLAICLKSFFGMFLVFFLVRRQWRLLATAVASYIVANLIGLLLFGIGNYHQYIAQHALVPLYVNASWNASIMGFFARIFGGAQNTPLISAPSIGYAISCGLSLVVIMILTWVSWPRQEVASADRFDLGFAATTIAMLLISPYAWIYYFPCLIIPLFVSWRMVAAHNSNRAFRIGMAALWILSSWPTVLIRPESAQLNDPKIWFISAGSHFYALIGFFILIAMRTGIAKRGQPAT